MNARKMSHSRGFLAIAAVLLVVILGFVAVTASYLFGGDSLSSVNHLRSAQAFYIGQAGLNAGRAAIASGSTCGTYASGVVSFAQGQYSVTTTPTIATSTLSSAIALPTATTISLASTAGFAPVGVVLIDAELIGYSGISGNNLINALRGVAGTTAATHLINASVTENQCLLTSTGAVPSIASSVGKRILKTVLTGSSLSISTGTGTFVQPALIALGSVTLSGSNVVTNPAATLVSPNYPGSTIYSASTIVLSGTANTKVGNGSGGLVPSSTAGNFKPDVVQNGSAINAGNLNSQFFTQSLATLQANAVTTYTSATINGAQGQAIYMSNTLILSGATTIGTAANPVLLILGNGLITSGSLTVNGFLYVVGGNVVSSGVLNVNGAFANTGSLVLSGSNNFNLSPPILTKLGVITNSTKTNYGNEPVTLQEVFP